MISQETKMLKLYKKRKKNIERDAQVNLYSCCGDCSFKKDLGDLLKI